MDWVKIELISIEIKIEIKEKTELQSNVNHSCLSSYKVIQKWRNEETKF